MIALEVVLFGAAILLFISVLSSKISERLSVPVLVIFLFIGMLAGSEGLGGIYFDDPLVAQSLGVIALIFILFSGGLDTPIEEVRPILLRGVLLATVGVLITTGILTGFVLIVLDVPLPLAFLVGAIVASTDAAAVFSILRTQKIALKGRMIPLLELESGSNDPMAVFLTISAIEIILQPQIQLQTLVVFFVQQMSIGLLLGLGIGYLTVRVINKLQLDVDGLYPVFSVAVVLFTYGFAAMLGGSGFLAIYVLGLMMSSRDFIHKNSLSRFHDGLAWLMQIFMFLTLGLLVFPSLLIPVAITGILIAFVLIFIARPLSVFVVLAFSRFDFRDKLMISWVGLRGATPIVLATFPLLAGIPQSDTIFNVVFFVVLVSVLLQGSTLIAVAKLLKITRPYIPKPQYPFELVSHNGIRDDLVEIVVEAGSPAINRQIVNLGLPAYSLIVLIARGQEILVPNGNTIIEQGDILLVLASKAALLQIQQWI